MILDCKLPNFCLKLLILLIICSSSYPHISIKEGIAERNVQANELPPLIKIGVILPLSGTYSGLAYSVLNAITAAAHQINNLGILGTNISLIVEDSLNLDHQAMIAYANLKAQSVRLILGPMFSGPAEQVAKQATLDHIVQITFAATSTALSSPQYTYHFRTIPPDDLQVQALEALMLNFGLHSVYIINSSGEWANSLVSNFYNETSLELANYSYDNIQQVLLSLNDTTIVSETQKYDSILLVALGNDVKEILPALKQAGLNNPLFGTEANVDNNLMDNPNSSIYPNLLSGTLPHVFTQGEYGYDIFVNALNDCYSASLCLVNHSNSIYDAYAYDAVWISAKAIQLAIQPDIQSSMGKAGASYIGATGNKSFTKNGDPLFSLYDIYQYQNTQYSKVGSWDSVSGLSLNNNIILITTQTKTVGSIETGVGSSLSNSQTNLTFFDSLNLPMSLIIGILLISTFVLVILAVYKSKKKEQPYDYAKNEEISPVWALEHKSNRQKISLSDETLRKLEDMIEESKGE